MDHKRFCHIRFSQTSQFYFGFLGLLRVLVSADAGDPMWFQYLDQEDPLEEGTAMHSSILVWRIPWTEDLAGYSPQGHKESDTTEAIQHAHVCQQRQSQVQSTQILGPEIGKTCQLHLECRPEQKWTCLWEATGISFNICKTLLEARDPAITKREESLGNMDYKY